MASRILTLVLACLLYATGAWAQGNDFPPFIPNEPPQPFVPAPNLGGQPPYVYRTLWGPYTLWEAKKGDTVEFAMGMNWFPGAIWLSPLVDSGSDMQWIGGGNLYNGQLGYFCIPACYFSFVAGQDYPNLQLDMYGPYRFWETNGGWLQVTRVIPGIPEPQPQPKQPLYTQEQKDRAAWWSGVIGGASSYIEAMNIGICSTNWKKTCFAGNVAHFLADRVKESYDSVVKDPLDPNYQYLYEPYLPEVDPGVLGLSWTGDSETDEIIYAAVIVNAYAYAVSVSINRASTCLEYRDPCWQAQLENVRYFQRVVGDWSRYAANRLYSLRDQEDDYDAWHALDYLGWTLANAGDDLMSGNY